MAFSAWRTWVTGETVTAAHMNQEVRDNGNALFPDEATAASWSPTLAATGTNPGTSSTTGRQYQIGAVMFVWVRFVLSSAGSGDYEVTLPASASGITANTAGGSGQAIGAWMARDDSVPTTADGRVLLVTADKVRFNLDGTSTGSGAAGFLDSSDGVPWTWASGDVLSFFAQYPVA